MSAIPIIPSLSVIFDCTKSEVDNILDNQDPAGRKELLDQVIEKVKTCAFSRDDINLFCQETVRREEVFDDEQFQQQLTERTTCLRLYAYFKIAQSKTQEMSRVIWDAISQISEEDMGGAFQIEEGNSQEEIRSYLSGYFNRKIEAIEQKINPN